MAAPISQQDLVKKIQDTLQLHKQGEAEAALRGYEEVLPRIAGGATKLSLLGNAGALYMSVGEYERAREHFFNAVQLAPENSQAHFNLAVLLSSKLGEHAKALKHCALAIRYDASNHKAHHLMGNILQNLGKHADAERYFQTAEAIAQAANGNTNTQQTDKPTASPLGIIIERVKSLLSEKSSIEIEGKSYNLNVVSHQPLAFTVDDFISEEECLHIQQRAESTLEKSFVMGNSVKQIDEQGNVSPSSTNSESNHDSEDPSLYRSSYNTWLAQDAMLIKIQERLSLLLQIPLGYVKQKSEDLQVVRYNLGGQFKAHQDSSAFHPRLLTALMYLDDLQSQQLDQFYSGGETWFPFSSTPVDESSALTVDDCVLRALNIYEDTIDKSRLPGAMVSPRKGKILVFFNYRADGTVDPLAVHAGLPLRRSSELNNLETKAPLKWIANYWLDLDEKLL